MAPDGFGVNGATGPEQLVSLGVQLVEAVVDRMRARDGAADPEVRPPAPPEARERALRRLARLNLDLAAALGACRCWGRRRACRVCGGAGRPGYFEIDPAAFAAFVAPAVAAQPHVFARRAAGAGGAQGEAHSPPTQGEE